MIALETVCPHCQASNTYKKVYKRKGVVSWISCRSCCRRYKLPLSVVSEITPAITEIFEHPITKDGAEKLRAYQEIAKQPLAHHRALFELGKLYLEAGNLAEAVPLLRQTLYQNSCNPDYQRLYAEALRQLGDEDLARAHEAQAQLLQDAGVVDMIFVADDEDIQLEAIIKDGLRAHQAGKLEEAEAAYRKVLNVNPDQADANHYLGVIAYQVGMMEESIELIARAIDINPEMAAYYCNLGNALCELGRLDEAAASHSQAITLNADYAKAHNNLGNVRLAQGHLDDAVASYRKALLISPDDAETLANLNVAIHQQGQMDTTEATL